jgi:hypothetical protein
MDGSGNRIAVGTSINGIRPLLNTNVMVTLVERDERVRIGSLVSIRG